MTLQAIADTRGFFLPQDFGVVGAGDDRATIQDALDAHVSYGVPLKFLAKTYLLGGALRFPSNCNLEFSGIDLTIFKLNDEAPLINNVIEPYTLDGTTTNCHFRGGFTVDGNYTRQGYSSGVGPYSRPGCSGFVTGGARYIYITGGVKAVDCLLHGIDITCGGEVEGGYRYYTAPTNESDTYYPPNETIYVYADYLLAQNCGDDGITGHYSKRVYVMHAEDYAAGDRHGTDSASNGIEIDDGCREWHIGTVVGRYSNRALAIKAHDGNPPPKDVTIGKLIASNCHQGLYVESSADAWGERVSVGMTHITDPINTLSNTLVRAVEIGRYTDVMFGTQNIHAKGDESFEFDSCISVGSSAYRISLGTVNINNWGYNNTDTSKAAIKVTSSCTDVSIDSLRGRNIGIRGVLNGDSNRFQLGQAQMIGFSMSGAVAIEMTQPPASKNYAVGPISSYGFDTVSKHGTVTSTVGISTVPHNIQVHNQGWFRTGTLVNGSYPV